MLSIRLETFSHPLAVERALERDLGAGEHDAPTTGRRVGEGIDETFRDRPVGNQVDGEPDCFRPGARARSDGRHPHARAQR